MTTAKELEAAAESAAAQADKKLESEEERLTTPTWESIRNMLPEPQDQAELDRMMAIIQQDTNHNQKVAALVHNINSIAGAVVKVMEKFT